MLALLASLAFGEAKDSRDHQVPVPFCLMVTSSIYPSLLPLDKSNEKNQNDTFNTVWKRLCRGQSAHIVRRGKGCSASQGAS